MTEARKNFSEKCATPSKHLIKSIYCNLYLNEYSTLCIQFNITNMNMRLDSVFSNIFSIIAARILKKQFSLTSGWHVTSFMS